MIPQVIKGFFKPKDFLNLKRHISVIAANMESVPIWEKDFNRHSVHNEPELVKIHSLLEPWLSGYLKRPVKKSYVFLSLYRKDGICPRHVDRPPCKYTVDVCMSQLRPWPIYIDDKPYTLLENDAILYSGTDSPHYRQRIQDGNHCFLIFFHFVPAEYEGTLD